MRPSHYLAATCLACGSSAIAAPFLAIGDNAELFLTGVAGVRYESNVYLDDTDEVDDFVFEFAPGFDLAFGKNSLVKGSLSAKHTFTEYADEEVNSDLSTIRFNASYDNAKFKASANAGYREIFQNSRDVLGAGTLVRRDIMDASVRGELRVSEKSKIASGLSYTMTEYETTGFRNSGTLSVPLNYYYEVTPKVDASAGVRYRKTYVYGGGPAGADRDDMYYNIGARGEFTSKLLGEFSIGYTIREIDGGGDNEMLGANAGLTYLYSPKTQFTLDLSNDFDTGSAGNSQEKFSTVLGGVTQLNANVSAGASLTYQNIDYSSGRQDDFFAGTTYATYVFNEHVSSSVAYSYQQNDSNSSTLDFTAHVISISASLRY